MNQATAVFGGGCFWCLEAIFSELQGVLEVVPGYSGGHLENPTYEQVCTDQTGHAEVVKITYNREVISYEDLLRIFFSTHDPTTLNRQGEDVGTQYRSVIFYGDDSQEAIAQQSLAAYQQAMMASGDSRAITTRILPLVPFYYAEDYHQQYLEKNPDGYCGLGGIGVCLPPSLNR